MTNDTCDTPHLPGTFRGMKRVAVTAVAVRYECPRCGTRYVHPRCPARAASTGEQCRRPVTPHGVVCFMHRWDESAMRAIEQAATGAAAGTAARGPVDSSSPDTPSGGRLTRTR